MALTPYLTAGFTYAWLAVPTVALFSHTNIIIHVLFGGSYFFVSHATHTHTHTINVECHCCRLLCACPRVEVVAYCFYAVYLIFLNGFQLGDLLIKPIQRIQKYHLLVKKILSYSEHANCPPHVVVSLREAVECTDIIPKNANSMMDVGRLQGFAVRNIYYLATSFKQCECFSLCLCNSARIQAKCNAQANAIISDLRSIMRILFLYADKCEQLKLYKLNINWIDWTGYKPQVKIINS